MERRSIGNSDNNKNDNDTRQRDETRRRVFVRCVSL